MTTRVRVGAAVAVLLCWGAWLSSPQWAQRSAPASPVVLPGPDVVAADEPQPAAPVGATAGRAKTRHEVLQAVERAAPQVEAEGLPGYLDGLLAQARQRGRVTALEAATGMEMISRFGGDEELQGSFVDRINALAVELRGNAAPATPATDAWARINALGDRIERGESSDMRERRALQDAYARSVGELDPDRQARAIDRLNALAGQMRAEEPPAADIEARWAAVHDSAGPERRAAIAALVGAVHELGSDEREAHMQRIDDFMQRQRESVAQ